MVKDEILSYPEPILSKRAREITEDEFKSGKAGETSLNELAEKMIALCSRTKNAAGLAAPQVGEGLRMIVVFAQESGRLNASVNPPEAQKPSVPIVAINPVFQEMSPLGPHDATCGKEDGKEGCLSLPGIVLTVRRAKKILVRYKDALGKDQEMIAEGLLAREVQHETDHLDGVLITRRGNLIANVRARKILRHLEDAYARRHAQPSVPTAKGTTCLAPA